MNSDSSKKTFRKKVFIILAVAVVIIATVGVIIAKNQLENSQVDTAAIGASEIGRHDLIISVTENGVIETRYTIDIFCQVETEDITIISLVEEGTTITDQDVANGMILMELDSSGLKDEFLEKDMDLNEERADYVESLRNLEIQIEQNTSDIMRAKLNEEFALMDLKKYLGEELTQYVFDQNKLGVNLFKVSVDVATLEQDPNRLGESLQKLRELRNAIEKAREDMQRAESKLAGTRKLFERQFVTKMELDADEAAYNQAVRSLGSREMGLSLFWDYEFIKQTKQLLSAYREAKTETARAESIAASRLATAQVQMDSRKRSLDSEEQDWERIRNSLEACVIRAPAPGVVIYGKENYQRGGNQSNMIMLGGTVRNRQKLISIPSTHDMVVKVKVKEKWIDMIAPGQAALISLDAYPGELFTGQVFNVAIMPSAADRRVSQTAAKVYETMVSIDGMHPEIRDGMNAVVEILIAQYDNVLCAPVQAVVSVGDRKICYVIKDNGTREERTVEVGAFNKNFIEIKQGLEVGELVSLIPTQHAASAGHLEEQKKQLIDRALEDKNGGRLSDEMGPESSLDRQQGGAEMGPEGMRGMRGLGEAPRTGRGAGGRGARTGAGAGPGSLPPGESGTQPQRGRGPGRSGLEGGTGTSAPDGGPGRTGPEGGPGVL